MGVPPNLVGSKPADSCPIIDWEFILGTGSPNVGSMPTMFAQYIPPGSLNPRPRMCTFFSPPLLHRPRSPCHGPIWECIPLAAVEDPATPRGRHGCHSPSHRRYQGYRYHRPLVLPQLSGCIYSTVPSYFETLAIFFKKPVSHFRNRFPIV